MNHPIITKQNALKQILTFVFLTLLLASCATEAPTMEQSQAVPSPKPVAAEPPVIWEEDDPLLGEGFRTEGDFEFDVEDGKAYLVRYTGSAAELTLPETLGGFPVAGMYDVGGFCNNTTLVSVTFPDNYTGGLYETFVGCTALTNVYIGKGIEKINTEEHSAFSNNPSLVSIWIDPDNPYMSSRDGVVFNKDGTELIIYPEGKRSEMESCPPNDEQTSHCTKM
jgi:hypothetical protein